MHQWTKREQRALKLLVSSSPQPYDNRLSDVAANTAVENTCGWTNTRPCPVYNVCTTTVRKRNSKQSHPVLVGGGGGLANHLGVKNKHTTGGAEQSYMSGTLTEDFRYLYKGGVSSRGQGESLHEVQSSSSLPAHPPSYHKHTLALDLQPLIAYRSSQMDARERSQLANVVAMQMKPELLIEQLIIENRLKTMSLSTFPVLEMNGKKSSQCPAAAMSKSSPALDQQQPVRKSKRKRRPKLEWCTVDSTKQPPFGANTSDLTPLLGVGRIGPERQLRASIQQKQKAQWSREEHPSNDGGVWSPPRDQEGSNRCPLHVVMPSLEPEYHTVSPARFKHASKLTSLAVNQPLHLHTKEPSQSDCSYVYNPI